jgi:soluble lytic murein transglycosylase-like protein
LALAGYNAGEYRVLRAMQQTDAKDFWSLRALLPRETAEYVPRVLAAISIARRTGSLQRRVGDPPHEATEYKIRNRGE